MSDINQFTLTEAVKASFKTEEGSRLKFLLETFIDHLHDYTREVGLTHAEIRRRIAFLDRDRALDGEVAAAVQLVADGSLLAALNA